MLFIHSRYIFTFFTLTFTTGILCPPVVQFPQKPFNHKYILIDEIFLNVYLFIKINKQLSDVANMIQLKAYTAYTKLHYIF